MEMSEEERKRYAEAYEPSAENIEEGRKMLESYDLD